MGQKNKTIKIITKSPSTANKTFTMQISNPKKYIRKLKENSKQKVMENPEVK